MEERIWMTVEILNVVWNKIPNIVLVMSHINPPQLLVIGLVDYGPWSNQVDNQTLMLLWLNMNESNLRSYELIGWLAQEPEPGVLSMP